MLFRGYRRGRERQSVPESAMETEGAKVIEASKENGQGNNIYIQLQMGSNFIDLDSCGYWR